MFLHSYQAGSGPENEALRADTASKRPFCVQTKFREPFSNRWLQALRLFSKDSLQVVSPLPEDLGLMLAGLTLKKVKALSVVAPMQCMQEPFPLCQSRRNHPSLHRIFRSLSI